MSEGSLLLIASFKCHTRNSEKTNKSLACYIYSKAEVIKIAINELRICGTMRNTERIRNTSQLHGIRTGTELWTLQHSGMVSRFESSLPLRDWPSAVKFGSNLCLSQAALNWRHLILRRQEKWFHKGGKIIIIIESNPKNRGLTLEVGSVSDVYLL